MNELDIRWYKGKYEVVVITHGEDGKKHQVAALEPIPDKDKEVFIAPATLLWRNKQAKT